MVVLNKSSKTNSKHTTFFTIVTNYKHTYIDENAIFSASHFKSNNAKRNNLQTITKFLKRKDDIPVCVE